MLNAKLAYLIYPKHSALYFEVGWTLVGYSLNPSVLPQVERPGDDPNTDLHFFSTSTKVDL